FRTVRCHGQRMLGVRRWFSVASNNGPFVRKRASFVRSEIQHRLYRKTITRPDLFSGSLPSVVRYLRCLVHRTTDAMASVIAHNAVPILLGMLLNGPTDVAYAVVRPALFYAKFKTFLG